MTGSPKGLNWRIAGGWGIGGGCLTVVDFAKVLLLGYLVDYVGMSAIVAGGIIALSKVYDAVIDPLIGVVSDKTSSPWGRRRPYLLGGGLACGFAYYLMFHVPRFGSSNETLLFVIFTLIVYATAYALFSVPYKAMSAEITDDYHARSTLMSIGALFLSLGSMAGASTAPTLIAHFGGGRAGHESMSLIMSAAVCVVAIVSFLLTSGARSRPPTPLIAGGPKRAIWSLFWQNKPFVILTLSSILRGTAVAFMNGAAVFYTRRVLKVSDAWLGQFFLILTAALIISLPAWLWISRRVGKKNAFLLGVLLIGPGSLSWLWASADEAFLVMFVRTVVIGAGSGSLIAMSQSMLPDVMEYDRRLSGLHREGIYAGFTTTVDKATVAFGIAVLGIILGATGYKQGGGADVVEPASALMGIYICFAVLPAVLLLASGAVMLFYTLDEHILRATGPIDEPVPVQPAAALLS